MRMCVACVSGVVCVDMYVPVCVSLSLESSGFLSYFDLLVHGTAGCRKELSCLDEQMSALKASLLAHYGTALSSAR